MYELRYYKTVKSFEAKDKNFDLVGTYPNLILAYGMRKKKAREEGYDIRLLWVAKV